MGGELSLADFVELVTSFKEEAVRLAVEDMHFTKVEVESCSDEELAKKMSAYYDGLKIQIKEDEKKLEKQVVAGVSLTEVKSKKGEEVKRKMEDTSTENVVPEKTRAQRINEILNSGESLGLKDIVEKLKTPGMSDEDVAKAKAGVYGHIRKLEAAGQITKTGEGALAVWKKVEGVTVGAKPEKTAPTADSPVTA